MIPRPAPDRLREIVRRAQRGDILTAREYVELYFDVFAERMRAAEQRQPDRQVSA
jgi:hypothetical protein